MASHLHSLDQPGSPGSFFRNGCIVMMLAMFLAENLHAQFALTTLASFEAGGTNAGGIFTNVTGAGPDGALIPGSDGCLYGTARNGGSNGSGTVFKVTTNGVLTVVVSFAPESKNAGGGLTNADGACPYAGLTPGKDGNFFGTTDFGGRNGKGTVFRVTTNGMLTSLVSFDNTNGKMPGALTSGNDDNFYGVTHAGGSGNGGTMFKVTASGILTSLRSFNDANLTHPNTLVAGEDGNFYGTAANGGANKYGAVFKVTTNGAVVIVASFDHGNGAYPAAGLTRGDDGNFYGTTFKGGSPGLNANKDYGTIFKVTTNGELTTLVRFNRANGARPFAGLTLGSDGNFYGTTGRGGSHDHGTIFRVTTGGELTTLVSFDGVNGLEPNDLIFWKDGNIYGTTHRGGRNGNGMVFKIVLRPPSGKDGPGVKEQ